MPPHSEIDPGTASRDAYETWHAGMGADAGGGPWHEMLKPELMAIGLGGRRILEIGCGRGGFACWLASQQPKPAEVCAADSPINNFMLLPWTRGMVRMAGCRIQKTEAVVHCLPFPGRPPLRFKFLDKAGFLTRWAGLHSMVVAVKQK